MPIYAWQALPVSAILLVSVKLPIKMPRPCQIAGMGIIFDILSSDFNDELEFLILIGSISTNENSLLSLFLLKEIHFFVNKIFSLEVNILEFFENWLKSLIRIVFYFARKLFIFEHYFFKIHIFLNFYPRKTLETNEVFVGDTVRIQLQKTETENIAYRWNLYD